MVTQPCPTLCDYMDCSLPCLHVTHYLLEFSQVYVHCIGDAIQPFHPLVTSFPALNLSQYQDFSNGLTVCIRWTQELQLQHQWSIPLHFREYSGLISLKNDYDTNKNYNSALYRTIQCFPYLTTTLLKSYLHNFLNLVYHV